MEINIFTFITDNLQAAGAIGGYVSISIIGFALINYFAKVKYKTVANKIGPFWMHPIIGSLFGAIPGCGATIVIASLFKNRKISFGGLCASFISTLGEGSFVLLGASSEAEVVGNLKAYLIITFFGLIAGIIFGYLCDFFKFRANYENEIITNLEVQSSKDIQNTSTNLFIEVYGFYALMLMIVFLTPGSFMALWGGSIDAISVLTDYVSIGFTLSCIIYFFINKFTYKNHNCYIEHTTYKSTVFHSIIDIVMVVTYVFIGLLAANYLIDVVIGVDRFDKLMNSSEHIVVFLAALIAVTPGCGGMIAVAVAFITIPNFPIAALIAAAIATSGDGIFPLFASNRNDAIIVSAFGFFIALIVGYLALYLGI